MDISSIKGRIDELENLVNDYFKEHVVTKANGTVEQAVEEFNARVQKYRAECDAANAELCKFVQELNQESAEIRRSHEQLEREKPDGQTQEGIEAFNAAVSRHNENARRHEERGKIYDQRHEDHGKRVDAINQEIEQRRAELDAVKKSALELVEEYKNWHKRSGSDRRTGPERLFHDLTALYAQLHEEARRSEIRSPDVSAALERLRALRKEMGERTRQEQDQAEHGLLIVPAVLGDGELTYMVVDMAASLTCLTPEMVKVLDLEGLQGEMVELSLPNGIFIEAPQLLLPKVTFDGTTAEFIKGAILRESMPGVDGCLGVSFLNRFDYSIERGRQKRLTLRPRSVTETTQGYDVFICHKSEDYQHAKQVYDALVKEQYRPFLSEVSVPASHGNDYHKAIELALESSMHLIVICATKESVNSPWVSGEWRLFDNLKKGGRKQGNIIPVVCGAFSLNDMPIALYGYSPIYMDRSDWAESLTQYLPKQS